MIKNKDRWAYMPAKQVEKYLEMRWRTNGISLVREFGLEISPEAAKEYLETGDEGIIIDIFHGIPR